LKGIIGRMSTVRIPDKQWKKIVAFLRAFDGVYVGNEAECRCFVEGVYWITRSGAQWRLLPTEYGNWNSVYKRFARWCDAGVWEAMHQHFAADPDMENGIIDSTVIRAHPAAAGAPAKKGAKRRKPLAAVAVASAPKSM
jgi:transposase